MTTEQQQVRDWMKAFGQDTPDKPIIPSLEVRKLRAKLILEEALETIEALGFLVSIKDTYTGQNWIYDNSGFDEIEVICVEPEFEPKLTEIADGCEDLKVVTEGTLIACGLADKRINHRDYDSSHGGGHFLSESRVDPLFDEVMRSNNSKMWTSKEMEAEINKTTQSIIFTRSQLNPDDERPWLGKDTNGKVIKSPSYSPANLAPIIDELNK